MCNNNNNNNKQQKNQINKILSFKNFSALTHSITWSMKLMLEWSWKDIHQIQQQNSDSNQNILL